MAIKFDSISIKPNEIMNLLNHLIPSSEQIKALMDYPPNTPVVMVNILKYKAKSGKGDESGRDAYKRYMKNVLPFLAAAGGKVVWKGEVQHMVIGDSENAPDTILLVEYPSVQHFLGMATSEEYLKIAGDRKIALEYGGLIMTSAKE